MPQAITMTNEEKFDLTTLPGAYVILKRMTYGQKMQRREAMKMKIDGSSKGSFEGELAMMNKAVTELEFSWCVVDHNLYKDEAETVKFNFKSQSDIEMLDPRVGEEIENLIDKMNNPDEDQLKN